MNENQHLSLLVQSALAITYAKMAERRPREKMSLVNQSLAEADKVLGEIESFKKRNKRLDKIYTFNETIANAFAAKGYAYTASEDYEKAIEYFKQAIQLNPRNHTSLLGLGEAYLRSGQKQEALTIFRKATIQSPMSGYINYRLGNLYRELGKRDEAVEILKRASQYAYACLTLGKIYLEDGEFEAALEEFRRATQLNSHLSEAWVNIAWTILQMEDIASVTEAVGAARRALQLEKNEKQYWHRHAILAFCLYQSGKKELALSEAKKAVELGPNQAQAHYYLALAQYGLGQYDAARQSLESVKTLDKKGDWGVKTSQLLEQL